MMIPNSTVLQHKHITPQIMRDAHGCTRCATLVRDWGTPRAARVEMWWNSTMGGEDSNVWVFLVAHDRDFLKVNGMPIGWSLERGWGAQWSRYAAQRLWRALVLPPTLGHGFTRLTPAQHASEAFTRLTARNA